jgi:hypothetical protein
MFPREVLDKGIVLYILLKTRIQKSMINGSN